MSKAPQRTIDELVEDNKTTVPILRQFLEYYRIQKPDLQQPKLKAELQKLLRNCLANNNLAHIQSYKRHGNNLVFPPAVDSKSDSDSNSDSKKPKASNEAKNKKYPPAPIRTYSKTPSTTAKISDAQKGAKRNQKLISTEVLTYHRHDDDNDEGPDRKRFKIDPGQTLKSPPAEQIDEAKRIEKIKNQLQQKEGLIYSGRYTRVYRCFDEIAGTEIAIKEFDSVSKGLHEAGMLRRILPADGIVKKVRDVHTRLNGKVQIWLELLSPLPDYTDLNELKHFMRGFLEALENMHLQHYIHGDVKHDNVMVDPKTNEIKLIDFGFTSEVWPEQTCRYIHGGTTVYFSPERIFDEPQTNKLDIFSAGLVCAEKMYGIRIKSMETRELLIKKVQTGELGGLATEEGVDLLRQMLKLDPDQRMSAEECLQHPFLNDNLDDSY